MALLNLLRLLLLLVVFAFVFSVFPLLLSVVRHLFLFSASDHKQLYVHVTAQNDFRLILI